MLIRSFQRRDSRRKRLFSGILVLLVIVLLWVVWGNIKDYYHQQTLFPVKNLVIWEVLSFEGNIKWTNRFPIYTHTVYNNDGVRIYLKSSSVNLNSYVGQYVKLKWEIKEIYKWSAIVNVSEVKIADEGLAIKDNTYVFSKDWLILDFKDQSQLSAKKGEKEIEVYYGDKKILDIERFFCEKLYKRGTCDELIDDYEKNGKDSFASYWDYTYYKHGTGLRTVFDGNKFGYIFKNIEDSLLLDISSNIKIIDAQDIIELQNKKISDACGFTSIGEWEVLDKEENSISVVFNWEKDQEEYPCTIKFDTQNERNILTTDK